MFPSTDDVVPNGHVNSGQYLDAGKREATAKLGFQRAFTRWRSEQLCGEDLRHLNNLTICDHQYSVIALPKYACEKEQCISCFE